MTIWRSTGTSGGKGDGGNKDGRKDWRQIGGGDNWRKPRDDNSSNFSEVPEPLQASWNPASWPIYVVPLSYGTMTIHWAIKPRNASIEDRTIRAIAEFLKDPAKRERDFLNRPLSKIFDVYQPIWALLKTEPHVTSRHRQFPDTQVHIGIAWSDTTDREIEARYSATRAKRWRIATSSVFILIEPNILPTKYFSVKRMELVTESVAKLEEAEYKVAKEAGERE
ncbi:MAG: hypothetical protein M1816_002354 [Peltula sp. TS41687]|nr:MAG: hypothetical protein M1816_002354 [Peltula sp. TS41687]